MTKTCHFCFWFVILLVLMSPIIYWAIISIPDSTDYFLQEVSSAKPGPNGDMYIFVGDDLRVRAYNYRHLVNGTCLIHVERVRENVGGKYAGRATVMQEVDQQFVGDGIVRRTTWPLAPERIHIDASWFDDPNVNEQAMDIYTRGTFECNPLDRLRMWLGFPRVHHDGEGHPYRERTRVVLRREKF